MTAKDQKILDKNPNAQPYELLALGLSEKGYQQILREQEYNKQVPVLKEQRAKIEPKKVTKVYSGIVQTPQHYNRNQNGTMVNVRNRYTGTIKEMTAIAAKLLIKRADQFEII